MFFILTTGRSGSKSISAFLSNQPKTICLHEPDPSFIRESRDYIYGNYNHDQLTTQFYLSRSRYFGNFLYGESNQRLSFIIPVINDAFPKSKFIFLIRDGRNVVSSLYSRGWYSDTNLSPSDFVKYSIEAPYVTNISRYEWKSMSPFEKCCWYWSFTNTVILKSLLSLNSNRWTIIKLEFLKYTSSYLLNFLNISYNTTVVFPWINKNAYMRKRQTSWADWSASDRRLFTKYCGDIMDVFYKNWRTREDKWVDISHHSNKQLLINKIQRVLLQLMKPKSPFRVFGRKHFRGTRFGDKALKLFNFFSGI